jgi:hypothetical protein
MKLSMKIRAVAGSAVALAVVSAAPAFAHHSYAMFDKGKSVTLDGTVKEFQWTNPHGWVQLVVRDPATGQNVEWSIQCNSLNLMIREGWSRTSLKAGDKAVVIIHPLLDGRTGGQLVTITVDGKVLSNLA